MTTDRETRRTGGGGLKIDKAWDRLEVLVDDLDPSAELVRRGARFAWELRVDGHDVALWGTSEAPRYCAIVDGCLSLRCGNVRALEPIIRFLCSREFPWTGDEVWDGPDHDTDHEA